MKRKVDKNELPEYSIFKIIWRGKKNLLTKLSWIFLGVIIGGLIALTCLQMIRFDGFSIASYLSICITGLSFSLALFVATKNLYPLEDLIKFYKFEDKDGKMKKKEAYYQVFAPFLFTAFIWLILAIIIILTQYMIIALSDMIRNIFIVAFLSILLLGVIALFNLIANLVRVTNMYVKLEADREE